MVSDKYTSFRKFFIHLIGKNPYPYQERLGEKPWPDLLHIPTGLGKTAAVLVAWLYKRLNVKADTPRRLIYCLPMRVLVEQTYNNAKQWAERAADLFREHRLKAPTVHLLMGGEVDVDWVDRPEQQQSLLVRRTCFCQGHLCVATL